MVCVCSNLYPPCIYSRVPRGETLPTDPRDQLGDVTWLGKGSGAHGPGRPTCRSVVLFVGPTAPIFFEEAVLGLLVWSTVVLAYFGLSELGSCITFGPSKPKSVL